jgi:hypothetical protein
MDQNSRESSPTANPPETTTKMPTTKLQKQFEMLNDESGENISSPDCELDSTERKHQQPDQ